LSKTIDLEYSLNRSILIYSTDGGVNWQASAIRVDTGDAPGSHSSWNPHIACTRNFVYVTWCDWRDGDGDIYVNYSNDSGAYWKTPDVRIDTGDAGVMYAYATQIACFVKKVFVSGMIVEMAAWISTSTLPNYPSPTSKPMAPMILLRSLHRQRFR
jgi:hypothetical protein